MTKDPVAGKQQGTTPPEDSQQPSSHVVGRIGRGPVVSLVVLPLLMVTAFVLAIVLFPLDRGPLQEAVQRLTRYPDDLTIQHLARRTMQALESSLPPECSGFDG